MTGRPTAESTVSQPVVLRSSLETSVTTLQSRLGELEAQVERGLATFVEVGQALLEIRDKRLYRESHDTFEDYCRERWGMSKTHANRQIEAAEVVGELTPIGVTPANEGQARELVPLKSQPEEMAKALNEASADGTPTAAKVKEAVSRRTALSQPRVPVDRVKVGTIAAEGFRSMIDAIGAAVTDFEDAPPAEQKELGGKLAISVMREASNLREKIRAGLGQ